MEEKETELVPESLEEQRVLRDEVQVPDPDVELSEEQVEAIRERAGKLLKKDTYINGAYVNLVIALRLYNTAMQSLNRRMDERKRSQGRKKENVEHVDRYLMAVAKNQAMLEFNRDELLDQIQKSTLPWLLAEVQDANDDGLAGQHCQARWIQVGLGGFDGYLLYCSVL